MIEVYQGENLYCRDNTFLGRLRAAVPRSKQGRQPVRVRFTYDINGLLEVEAATGSEKPQRLVIKNDSMSDQEAERRLQELSALKMHPREQEVPRALIARAERLYVASVGRLRGEVFRRLEWYQNVLNSQDPILAGKASRVMRRFLDQAEAWMGEDVFQDMEFDGFHMEDGGEEELP